MTSSFEAGPALDLTEVTDSDVRATLHAALSEATAGSDSWRILGAALRLSERHSFSATRTYPRPDHPNPTKRKPLIYTLVGILVSLRTTLENEQRAMAEVLARFPTPDSLRGATEAELAVAVRSAGMGRVRARRIRSAMTYIDDNFNGSLESLATLSTAEARAKLLAIPGFGPKAADCLLSIGLGKASIAVDVNVFRVTSWLLALPWAGSPDYGDPEQLAATKRRLDAALPDRAFICQIVHTLFLLHGKNTGRVHSNGQDCALRPYCLSCN